VSSLRWPFGCLSARGVLKERDLNADYARRVVVGYGVSFGPLAGMVSVGSSVPAQCLLYAGPRSYSQYSTSWSDHLMTSPLRFEFMVSEM
jgi:hypothetical protein